ncbi:ABC transporter [Colletotrichum orchidophilum]|uniref:ABC transporter n=1 Tax=Colletotrichum orchidophilum TaxID=1209926 RepID=A0A1G4ATP8_9PEZI|nr:ABC transporter [Colletotrichum orchidophilum]OHE92549.1 ABC transporter [Colletotrichum orchidophilum]
MLVSIFPASMLSSFVGSQYFTKNAGRITESDGKDSSIASEILSHISVGQAFGGDPRLETKFAYHMITAHKTGMEKAAAGAVQTGRGDCATVDEIYAIVYLLVDVVSADKSTVAALLARLRSPDQGDVLLKGHNFKKHNVRSLRSSIGSVQQEPSLLDRSIFENIALGFINPPKPSHQLLKPYLSGGPAS